MEERDNFYDGETGVMDWQFATEGQPMFGIEEENSQALDTYLASAMADEDDDSKVEDGFTKDEDSDDELIEKGEWGSVDPQQNPTAPPSGNEPAAPGSAV